MAGIKIGFGMKQQKLYAKRYYFKKLRNSIKDDDRYVRSNYRARAITRDELNAYYNVLNAQLYYIDEAFQKTAKDTVALNEMVKKGGKKINQYVRKNFKSNP